MKKRLVFPLIFIMLLFIFGILINLPSQIVLHKNDKLPFIGTKITKDTKINLVNLNTILHLARVNRDFTFRRGLDLEGGTSITLRANMSGIPATERDDVLNSAKDVIERRLNSANSTSLVSGVFEPVVQTAKVGSDYRIIAEIPGVTDLSKAEQLIGTTAKLTFWEADPTASISALASTSASMYPVGLIQQLGGVPKETGLSGKDLKQATVVFDPSSGEPQVQLTFSGAGTKKFSDISTRNVGKPVAFVLDNIAIEAPIIQQPITTGVAVVNGSFTVDQAKKLASLLQGGALPVALTPLQTQAIGATLGQASLEKSLLAGILGFLVIVVFMVVLYGRLGVIASVALILYTLLLLALFRLIPITLTLPGIAAFILSIGIAVDANILIFERMREEMRKGKSHETAMELGFSRAWASIRDSNIASLITSSVLYMFGTGMVKGFAVNLALGVGVSLFSAVFVTRTLLRLFYRN
jgi:preprotein translocase subunit SecD